VADRKRHKTALAARWRIAHLLNRLPGQCWTDLVWWVQRDRRSVTSRNPWSPQTPGCWRGMQEQGVCYCGKLRSPEVQAELDRLEPGGGAQGGSR
jgi:hypothetical protein